MKTYSFSSFRHLLLCFFLFVSGHLVYGQAGTAVSMTIQNMVQLTPSSFEYEVYATNTGTTALALRSYSWGLNVTPGIINGGTITHSFVSRDASLAGFGALSAQFTSASNHLRGTIASLASSGSEVPLPLGVPLRIATMRVNNTVSFPINFNPFLPASGTAMQLISAPGKTQCILGCWVNYVAGGTPLGLNYNITSPLNAASGTSLNVLTGIMSPSPTGPTPFLLNACTGSTNGQSNITACNTYIWPSSGLTYTQSGTYYFNSVCGSDTLNLTIHHSSTASTDTIQCGSFTWSVNGVTYTSSGTYTYTSLNAFGCLHTDTLHVTITPLIGSTSSVTSCDSYSWVSTGMTYTSSGTYYNTGSCGSDTLNLTILTSSTNLSYNAGCDTYSWSLNRLTYTTSGTYTVTSLNAAGCIHNEQLQLTINATTSSTINITEIANTYTWPVNGMTYTVSGTYTATSLNAAGCLHTAQLNLTLIGGTSALMTMTNFVQTSPFSFEYDVYCTNTGTANLSLRGYTWGLNHTPGLNNGGIITHSFVSRDASLSSIPAVIPGYTSAINHLRGTTLNASPGSEVLLTPGVSVRLATMRVSSTTSWPTNSNPFLPATGSAVQTVSAAGKFQCVLTVIVTPPGGTYVLNGPANAPVSSTLQVLTSIMTPSPTGPSAFMLNPSFSCAPIIAHINATACDSFTWATPAGNGNTYNTSGTYAHTTAQAGNPTCTDTTYLHLTINHSSTSTSNAAACTNYTWTNGVTYTTSGTYTYTSTNLSGCDSIQTLILNISTSISVSPKVFLSGAYAGNGMMHDSLRIKDLLPPIEPYTALGFMPVGCSGYNGGETVSSAMLEISGANAIVDWVHIEIRATNASYTKVASQNALLQRDGDITDVNGNPLTFACLCAGNYYVVVKHRNHLGVMTAASSTLSATPQLIDFTSNTPVWTKPGVNSPAREINGNYRLLWPGDTRTNKNIKYNGSNNDKDPILTSVGLLTPNNIVQPAYRKEDVNMDGRVKYNNVDNDKNFILNKILQSNFPVSTPNDVLQQHTPN